MLLWRKCPTQTQGDLCQLVSRIEYSHFMLVLTHYSMPFEFWGQKPILPHPNATVPQFGPENWHMPFLHHSRLVQVAVSCKSLVDWLHAWPRILRRFPSPTLQKSAELALLGHFFVLSMQLSRKCHALLLQTLWRSPSLKVSMLQNFFLLGLSHICHRFRDKMGTPSNSRMEKPCFLSFTPSSCAAKHPRLCMHHAHNCRIDESEVGLPNSPLFQELSRFQNFDSGYYDHSNRFLINNRWTASVVITN